MEFLKRFPGGLLTGCLFLLCCGPPRPIEIDAERISCSWQNSGGDPGRASFVNFPTPDQPRLLWSVEFESSLYMQPTAALGFLLVPTIDKRVHVISANKGTSVAEIKFRDVIMAPLALDDSMMAINLEGNKLVVGNWVNQMFDWQADLEGSSLEPLIFDKAILWLDGENYLRCFDLKEGKRIWDEKLDGNYAAPPAASAEGFVVAASDGKIECFDPENGNRIWQSESQGRFRNPPVIVDGYVLVASTGGHLEKISIADGRRIWQSDLRSPVYAPIASDGQGVFVGTNNRMAVRLDFSSGKIDWETSINGPIKAGPVITSDLAVFVSIDHNAYFLDKVTGEVRYVFETEGMLTMRPVVCDDKVYIAGEDDHLYCLQLSKEE